MIKGKVIEWNDSKGYGFISALNGELRVFLHISTVQSKGRRPKVDDEVKFEVNEDKKGRYNATNVTILGSGSVPSTIMFSIVYLVLASTAVFILGGEKLFIAAYILMSIVTYVMYAIDKNAAQNGKWRTPENTLHLLSLLGGWMGALCAQNQFRHKSKKQPFKSILWLTIFVNIGAFVWTFTPSGSVFVQNFISNWF
ncbi:TPA: cold shock and DUF1294 domain-containing protein [Vibrio parahaemolyticus]|uniref:cold shock and DUF1294 domain-containing protein n=2 Tax=Vibrio harveyi group TaxID=717610 RepID=UPI0014869276|nr:cold shock and DUF1294 domain-containing protein [Vibrio alginolyticus]HCE2112576.1 cold shock and DUF1294 domain-containing protein [Vibrio parahaemolyticus]HCE2386867.1 cold shock and DUF1294 domain-containing protein [Vibrio parahaemolyticus]HCE2672443.1 cold shock and DUF1294 domain-containing protein [Vibrio parahaemolyticus]HCE4616112.1 cold shock and DUF1294 domain-containing protein [Vibrio parahaemolyticus]HCG6306245.1 cold shock and DUF1294 domain-containing protein [Vibrio paraha